MTQLISLPPQPFLDLSSGTVRKLDISDFSNSDFISVALPAYPASKITAGQSFIDITSSPTGDCDGTPTDSLPFSASTLALIDGDCELRLPLSLLVNVDRKAITGIRFRVQASSICTFRAMTIRCVSSTWDYAPIDMDTLYHRGKRPVAPDGSLTSPPTFPTTVIAGQPTEFPILFRSDNPPGVTDPRPIDANMSMAFHSGSLTTATGDENYAVCFTTGYIDIGNPASLQFTGSFALEAWIKPATLVGTQAIISKYVDTAANRGYRMGITPAGEITVDISGDGTAVTNFTTSGAGFTTGLWQHVFMQYKVNAAGSAQLPLLLSPGGATASVSVYKNGNFIGSAGSFPTSVFNPTYTNLVTNPGFEIDTSGWTLITGTQVRSSAWSSSGGWSLKCTSASGTGVVTNAYFDMPTPVIGARYTASIRINKIDTIARGVQMGLLCVGGPSNNTLLSDYTISATTGQQTLTTINPVPVPAGCTSVRLVVLEINDGAAQAANWYFDDVMIVQSSTAPSYFDGGSPYSTWNGTPNASTSTFGAPFRIANWP